MQSCSRLYERKKYLHSPRESGLKSAVGESIPGDLQQCGCSPIPPFELWEEENKWNVKDVNSLSHFPLAGGLLTVHITCWYLSQHTHSTHGDRCSWGLWWKAASSEDNLLLALQPPNWIQQHERSCFLLLPLIFLSLQKNQNLINLILQANSLMESCVSVSGLAKVSFPN